MSSQWWVYILGYMAQGMFCVRSLIQWIKSEKAKKVENPSLFWIFSLIGSILFLTYGWLRDDFAIILGQLISYYVYVWNINNKGIIKTKINTLNIIFLWALISLPLTILFLFAPSFQEIFYELFHTSDLPLWLIIYGSFGQLLYTYRFVYQFIYSYKHGESTLPQGFWIISLAGSLIIISYALMRLDPVLLLGQSFSCISFIRNIALWRKNNK